MKKIKEKLKNIQFIRFFLLPVIRKLKIWKNFIILFLHRSRYTKFFAPPHHIFYVKPDDIIWHTDYNPNDDEEIRNRNFPMNAFRGKVIDGNWDHLNHKFDELLVYKAIRDRILAKTDWKETHYFKECLDDINKGRPLWGCYNDEQLLERFSFIDNIIQNISENGYKEGYNICLPGEDPDIIAKHPKLSEEVTINIGRNGDFLFQDGRHRLAIAKVLEIKIIPVKVLVRHQQWYEKIRLLNENSSHSHEYSNHPDYKYLIK